MLDKPLDAKVVGSVVGSDVSSFTLDWKTGDFGTGDMRISSLIRKMGFKKTKKEFSLVNMVISQANVGGQNIVNNELKVFVNFFSSTSCQY